MSGVPYRSKQLDDFTLALSGTAASLGDHKCVGVLLQSDPDNTDDILIGNVDSQSMQLTPGQSFSLTVENTSIIYAKSVSGTPDLNYLITM